MNPICGDLFPGADRSHTLQCREQQTQDEELILYAPKDQARRTPSSCCIGSIIDVFDSTSLSCPYCQSGLYSV